MNLRRPWWFRVFDATSQWCNTVFLNGEPNESISGRSHRKGWSIEKYIDWLIGGRHCYEAYENDVYRAKVLVVEDIHREQQQALHRAGLDQLLKGE